MDNPLNLTVDAGGNGDFLRISDALASFPQEQAAHIRIQNGVYREKLFCDKRSVVLEGESREHTLLTWADGARDPDETGKPLGTFRSYTAFFDGEALSVRNLTIENACGEGRVRGQGIAAAVYTAHAQFENVRLLGYQDTLFTGPLPAQERQTGGFLGPRQHAPRRPSRQFYRNCEIRGNIDFIFGGADALFERCLLVCCGAGETQSGFLAAPSTPPDGIGYIFHRCTVTGDPPRGYYLARPWRSDGKAAFLNCRLGECVHPDGFSHWGELEDRAVFGEYACSGSGAAVVRPFGQAFSQAEAVAFYRLAGALRHR